MPGRPILRTVAVAASTAMLLSSIAGSASGAQPTCAGRVATIVGTAEGETIVGTKGRDVIVARGGNDRVRGRGGEDIICGGPGNDTISGHGGSDVIHGGRGDDRLFGGWGNDRLYGGPGDDRFDGGPETGDHCNQAAGDGMRFRCEWPRIKRVGKAFAIAFVDLDGDHRFGPDDVLISRLVDTNRDGRPSKGDTIEMGRYPITTTPKDIGDTKAWGVKRHTVASVHEYGPGWLWAVSSAGGIHEWGRSRNWSEWYNEVWWDDYEVDEALWTGITDGHLARFGNAVATYTGSPSRPSSSLNLSRKGAGDDGLLDVRVYWHVP